MTSDEFELVMDDPTMRRACFLYVLDHANPGLTADDVIEIDRRMRAMSGDQVVEAVQAWSPFLTILQGMT